MLYLLSLISTLMFSTPEKGPVELGKVQWIRNYDEALRRSEAEDKPVFILFQEVPGCSTCKNYGENVLSHPFIVEAIEDEFIPLVIYNNKGGADKKVLEIYNEPTWNNPVVRVVDSQGENVVRRLYSNYSKQGVISTMIDALLKSNKIVPEYLHLFSKELETNSGKLKESYVSMYCFWTGEKVLGSIDGVAETEAGFMDGKEVVKFKYNPELVEYQDIVKEASKLQCADGAYTNDASEKRVADKVTKKGARGVKAYRTDKTPKYYLANTIYQYIPMTTYQSVKINAALGKGDSPLDLLSPRQLKLLNHVQKNKSNKWERVFQDDFTEKWWDVSESVS